MVRRFRFIRFVICDRYYSSLFGWIFFSGLVTLKLVVRGEIDMASSRPSIVRTVASLDPSTDSYATLQPYSTNLPALQYTCTVLLLFSDDVSLIVQRLVSTDAQSCSVLSVATNGQVTIQNLRYAI